MQISSISGICLTKLDVLDGLETIKICTGYRLEGEVLDVPPVSTIKFAECEPVYEEMAGWSESTVGMTDYNKLPENAKAYIKQLEVLLETPIDIISTGPERMHTIVLKDPYSD